MTTFAWCLRQGDSVVKDSFTSAASGDQGSNCRDAVATIQRTTAIRLRGGIFRARRWVVNLVTAGIVSALLTQLGLGQLKEPAT